jgi:hypothetical protein
MFVYWPCVCVFTSREFMQYASERHIVDAATNSEGSGSLLLNRAQNVPPFSRKHRHQTLSACPASHLPTHALCIHLSFLMLTVCPFDVQRAGFAQQLTPIHEVKIHTSSLYERPADLTSMSCVSAALLPRDPVWSYWVELCCTTFVTIKTFSLWMSNCTPCFHAIYYIVDYVRTLKFDLHFLKLLRWWSTIKTIKLGSYKHKFFLFFSNDAVDEFNSTVFLLKMLL